MPALSRPSISLTKHHGLGNDFLVAVEPPRALTSADAVAWCNRREGIGADGLIMATALGPTRWRMVLWNSDGGRAELSGNGLRCLAQALAEHLGQARSDRARLDDLILVIETDAGTREATVVNRPAGSTVNRPAGSTVNQPAGSTVNQPAGSTGAGAVGGAEDLVRVGMGKAVDGPAPSGRWAELGVPVIAQAGVDLGNPHLVAFVGSLDDIDMAAIGPVVEADYPNGLNVHVARVVEADRIEMVIWERGAGSTMACGSGACAVAWAANRAGLLDTGEGATISVDMPGGSAQVELAGDDVVLVGPAVRVAEVRIDG